MIDLTPIDVAVLNVLIRAGDWVHAETIGALVFPNVHIRWRQTNVRVYIKRMRDKGLTIENLCNHGYRYLVSA